MNKRKLRKLRRELQEIRANPFGRRDRDLVGYAKAVHRTKSLVGKHPTYVRDGDPALAPPLSIPAHRGDMAPGTVQCIVDILLSDLDAWEIHLMLSEEE